MPVPRKVLLGGDRVYLRRPRPSDAKVFLAAVRASQALHGRWVRAPATGGQFTDYLRRFAGPRSRNARTATHIGMIVCRREDEAPVGVFNFSEIVRGAFQSSYLGYYSLEPHSGQGYMSEGLHLVLAFAFRELRLHRVEVNVQPSNKRSSALVRRAGFTREGFSRRYAKIAGVWRNHDRWAMLVEDWRAKRRRRPR
jgi:ribosomal-protein-alanine N-acetyltransferase